MHTPALHRFEEDGKRLVIDPETGFCFECDVISWDLLAHYPHEPLNRILTLLEDRHPRKELEEVISELEWLRATKAILPAPKLEEYYKRFELTPGLKRLTVYWPGPEETPRPAPGKHGWFKGLSPTPIASLDAPRRAAALLLARSGTQKELYLDVVLGAARNARGVGEVCAEALDAARLAGKKLTVAVSVSDPALTASSSAFAGHTLYARLELRDGADAPGAVRAFLRAGFQSPARLAKLFHGGTPGLGGRIVLRPGGPEFKAAVQSLEAAGFQIIELDLDGAFVANPELEPLAMAGGLRETARYYAQRLLDRRLYRLDPIASIFWRIHNGTPLFRADPAGLNELAIAEDGTIYPSRLMIGAAPYSAGSLSENTIDKDVLRSFEDIGSLTTPACMRCWARRLCGGGAAAVHQALGGSIRKPHTPWCEAQRAWMASAVAAFNLLSSANVNFSHVYQALGRPGRPSIFEMARAALSMRLSVRPLQESDATLLTRWENWNEAAYFLCNETGLLLATRYDREMDSIHPHGIDQELLLTRRDGTPMGLLKIRPGPWAATAQAWLYLRLDADYRDSGIRKSFRYLLREVAAQHGLRRLIVPAGPGEEELAGFLEAIGFQCAGVQREALYLHGAYHDVRIFMISTET